MLSPDQAASQHAKFNNRQPQWTAREQSHHTRHKGSKLSKSYPGNCQHRLVFHHQGQKVGKTNFTRIVTEQNWKCNEKFVASTSVQWNFWNRVSQYEIPTFYILETAAWLDCDKARHEQGLAADVWGQSTTSCNIAKHRNLSKQLTDSSSCAQLNCPIRVRNCQILFLMISYLKYTNWKGKK